MLSFIVTITCVVTRLIDKTYAEIDDPEQYFLYITYDTKIVYMLNATITTMTIMHIINLDELLT